MVGDRQDGKPGSEVKAENRQQPQVRADTNQGQGQNALAYSGGQTRQAGRGKAGSATGNQSGIAGESGIHARNTIWQ